LCLDCAPVFLLAISTFGIVLIVLAVILLLFVAGGVAAVVTRSRRQAGSYAEHVAAADSALEQARAADKGWNRESMEAAARDAIAESRPSWSYGDLHLVFVDDRPGVTEDRAHFVAIGADGECRVILARQDDRWVAERVE
jgi:Na+-transporting methylmalonyl-CoA/oxaloacetate decarboxylase gamma subunit